MNKYKPGYYYFINKDNTDLCLTEYYYNSDSGCYGFGFNISDGGGFLPEDDIIDQSIIEPVNIHCDKLAGTIVTDMYFADNPDLVNIVSSKGLNLIGSKSSEKGGKKFTEITYKIP